tara:strand:- start:384 stop:518 length:135 start_codon:yes stop_codon:yes gene_type:complete
VFAIKKFSLTFAQAFEKAQRKGLKSHFLFNKKGPVAQLDRATAF